MRKIILNCEELDTLVGFNLSEDSFFSEGTIIRFGGGAWELLDTVGDCLMFGPSNDDKTSFENMQFFFNRYVG